MALIEKNVILIFQIVIISSSRKNSHWPMLQNSLDYKSILVRVMVWCRQATNHCLSQCWPRLVSPYGVTMPEWSRFSTRVLFCQQRLTKSDWMYGIAPYWQPYNNRVECNYPGVTTLPCLEVGHGWLILSHINILWWLLHALFQVNFMLVRGAPGKPICISFPGITT